jgi:predicted nucleotidyltransferase
MSEAVEHGGTGARFGLHARTLAAVHDALAGTPGLLRVWVFGSRATGRHRPASDLDLALDAPGWSGPEFAELRDKLDALGLMVRIDALHWQAVVDPVLRAEIERDRRELWPGQALRNEVAAVGGVALMEFPRSAKCATTRAGPGKPCAAPADCLAPSPRSRTTAAGPATARPCPMSA